MRLSRSSGHLKSSEMLPLQLWLVVLSAVSTFHKQSKLCIYPHISIGWYYFGPREQGNMPKHPTLSAFGRASTLSLGSIAFGSLIVTILELIKMLLNIAKNNANAEGHRK